MKQNNINQAQVILTIIYILISLQPPINSMELPNSFEIAGVANPLDTFETSPMLDTTETVSVLSELDKMDKKLEFFSRHTSYHDSVVSLIPNKNSIAQDSTGRTRLHYAMLAWEVNLIATLMEYPLSESATSIQDKEGETALHLLFKRCFNSPSEAQQTIDLVKLAMRQRTKLGITNNQGETYVHYAVRVQDYDEKCTAIRKELIKLLVMGGIPINACTEDGETALHYAMRSHPGIDDKPVPRLAMVPTLLELGANATLVDTVKKNSLLHYAVENRLHMHCGFLSEVIKMLIQKGCSPNAKNNLGFTPLYLLVTKEPTIQTKPIAQLLLDQGADPNLTSKDGYAPLHVAICNGKTEWADLLMAHPSTNKKLMHEPHPRTVAPQPVVGRTFIDIADAIYEFKLGTPDPRFPEPRKTVSKTSSVQAQDSMDEMDEEEDDEEEENNYDGDDEEENSDDNDEAYDNNEI